MADQGLDELIQRTEGLIQSIDEDSPDCQPRIHAAHSTFMETYDRAIGVLEIYLVQVIRAVDFLKDLSSKFSGSKSYSDNFLTRIECNSHEGWFSKKSYSLKLTFSKKLFDTYYKQLEIDCNFNHKAIITSLSCDYEYNGYVYTPIREKLSKDKFRTGLSQISLQGFESQLKGSHSCEEHVLKVPQIISEIPKLVIYVLEDHQRKYQQGSTTIDQDIIGLENLQFPDFPDLKLE